MDTILTKKTFSKIIEAKVKQNRMEYIDAILEVCKEKSIDPSEVSSLLNNIIKQKIEAEAIRERKIKGNNNSLPL